MPEQNPNLWSPWRMEYIEGLAGTPGGGDGCFLCGYRDSPAGDTANLVLWRSPRTLVLMNKFPYTNGHLLVAPTAHIGQFEDVPDDVHAELVLRVRDAKRVLDRVVRAQGYNIGINLGACAGAGLPQHVHWHIVPRWGGDTGFMAAVGSVRLIPQAMDTVYERFLATAAELGLQ